MGQKVNPIGLRLGYIRSWDAKWYSKMKNYGYFLQEDLKIRFYLKNRFRYCEIARVEIIRYPDRININIETSRPGLIIGKKGVDIENTKKELYKITQNKIYVNILEVSEPSLNANLVSQNIVRQIENKISYKKVMKQSIYNTMRGGKVKGIKILISGRLGGAEMARKEKHKEGRVPLQNLRANIDYGFNEALTKFGKIGVKVWIYKGEILDIKKR